MKTYSFDIQMFAVAHVKAASHREAVKLLDEALDCIELDYRRDHENGVIELTEASMSDDPELYAVDHDDAFVCPGCGAVEGEPEWGTVGDGAFGYCPACADKEESE